MRCVHLVLQLLLAPIIFCFGFVHRQQEVRLNPAAGQQNVNVDAQLSVIFPSSPTIGSKGKIQVYRASDNQLVDTLDLSIPFSPSPSGNGSTKANYTDTTPYQTNIIGGMDFYYNPIIVRGNKATIYLHNNKLDYNTSYKVAIDPGVLYTGGRPFQGFSATSNPAWEFSTKSQGPAEGTTTVTVSADGTGDFNTVQGALDWAPAQSPTRITILVRDGTYEELVFFQYKTNLSVRGQSRNGTVVTYPNNSAFNPPNRQGPSRRPAFSFRGVADVQLRGFTVRNSLRGQAEALLSDGVRVVLSDMALHGSGDALTTYGSLYVADSSVSGDGDTVLGYAAAYWVRSSVAATGGALTWTRTSRGSHGNVLVGCTLVGGGGAGSVFARLPDNKGGVLDNWPDAEMVLIDTRTEGIAAAGWAVAPWPFDASRVRFWEHNTTDLEGRRADRSQRLNISRELRLPQDEIILKRYRDPAYVLGGWSPVVV
jgi:pectinesterase